MKIKLLVFLHSVMSLKEMTNFNKNVLTLSRKFGTLPFFQQIVHLPPNIFYRYKKIDFHIVKNINIQTVTCKTTTFEIIKYKRFLTFIGVEEN